MANASNTVTTTFTAVDNISRTSANIDKNVAALTKSFTKLSGAFQNAFQFYVRFRIFGLINQGISALEGAIPGLIARGQQWAQTVDDIADSTGLSAERSSLLAASVQLLTGNVEGLERAMGALSANAANHADVFKRYGIDVKGANGELLDSWTIMKNVRGALSDLGNGFITTAAARELFSRGGQTLLDFLTLSDEQFRMMQKDVRESGVLMTQAGVDAGEAWVRTQRRFEMSITGIANQITQGVQPLLTRLVDGITEYLRANMANIARFVAQVVSFAANAVAGFLGIDLDIPALYEDVGAASKKRDELERKLGSNAKSRDAQTDSEDRYSKALNGQIDAIDKRIEALDRQARAEDARRQQAELLQDIADARKELEQIRSKSIFAAGMSYAEAELARQAQAADIVDAQERVREAQQKLEEQARDDARDTQRQALQDRRAALQQRLADHMKMLAKESAAERESMSQLFDPKNGVLAKLPENLKKVGEYVKEGLLDTEQAGKEFGRWAATTFSDTLSHLGGIWETIKTEFPSWMTTLSTIGSTFGDILTEIQKLLKSISDMNPFGSGEGKVDLGLSPATLALGGIAAWKLKGLGARMLGGLFPGAGGALGAAASNAVTSVAGPTAPATTAAVGSTLAVLARGAFVTSIASLALKMATGGVSPEETLRRGGLRDTPTNRRLVEVTGVNEGLSAQKSLQDLGQTLFGGLKLHELWEGQQKVNEKVSSALGEGGAIATSQQTIAQSLGKDGQLVTDTGVMATALGPSGDVPSLLREVSANTNRLSRPGAIWGVANMNVYLDKDLVLQLAGVPIRSGNTSTRPQRAN